jgi:hypothetical protein
MTLKKYYNFQFELGIDGIPRPAESAVALFQRDPLPGGHTYRLVISGKRLRKYFSDVPLGQHEGISEEDARRYFLSLGMSFSSNPNEKNELEYFLNTIEEIDFDDDRIMFSGICSPVVKG